MLLLVGGYFLWVSCFEVCGFVGMVAVLVVGGFCGLAIYFADFWCFTGFDVSGFWLVLMCFGLGFGLGFSWDLVFRDFGGMPFVSLVFRSALVCLLDVALLLG